MPTNGPDGPKFTSVTACRSLKLLRFVHVLLRGFVVAAMPGCSRKPSSPHPVSGGAAGQE